ncbi:hypothetical protein D3C72_2231590 [compost metagenome]
MPDDAVQRYSRHGAGCKQVHAKRRRDHAHGQVHYHDQAKVHRVHTKVDSDRCQDRRQHDDGGTGLDEHADDEQRGIHAQQEEGG